MNRYLNNQRWEFAGVPRVSGDEPALMAYQAQLQKSSPRKRG